MRKRKNNSDNQRTYRKYSTGSDNVNLKYNRVSLMQNKEINLHLKDSNPEGKSNIDNSSTNVRKKQSEVFKGSRIALLIIFKINQNLMSINMEILEQLIVGLRKPRQENFDPTPLILQMQSMENPEVQNRQKMKKWRGSRIETQQKSFGTKNISQNIEPNIMKGKKTEKEKIGQLVQGLKGKTTYVVTGMNSIILHGDLIYDFFQTNKSSPPKSTLKCNCTKSKCKAKYCSCFADGAFCGPQCGCTNCENQLNKMPLNAMVAEKQEIEKYLKLKYDGKEVQKPKTGQKIEKRIDKKQGQ